MGPIRALALSLGLLTLALNGCGGEGHGEDGSVATDEATVEQDAAQIPKLGVAAYAQAVNLRASDVPYFKVMPDEDDEDPELERRLERTAKRCMGLAETPDASFERDSPTFGADGTSSNLQVESTVSVTGTPAETSSELAVFKSPRAIPCLRRFFVETLSEEETAEAEFGDVALARIPVPDPEIDGGVGFRFKATVTVQPGTTQTVAYRAAAPPAPVSLDVYLDYFAFTVGRAGVSLSAIGIPAPVGKSLERNLLRLLHERAVAHSP